MSLLNQPIILGAIAIVIVLGGLSIIDVGLKTFNEISGSLTRMITGETEYCVTDTYYARTLIGSEDLSISRESGDTSEICFKTADEDLARDINDKIQDRMLQESVIQAESNQEWWQTVGLPISIIVVIAIVIIVVKMRDSGYP